jgi:hypothetical protein
MFPYISPVANLQPRLVLLVRVAVVALPRSRIAEIFMQAVSLAPAFGIKDKSSMEMAPAAPVHPREAKRQQSPVKALAARVFL